MLKDIQKTLNAELKSLISGKTDIKRAKAVADLSAQAIYVARLEIENKRLELDIAKDLDAVKKWDKFNLNTIKL